MLRALDTYIGLRLKWFGFPNSQIPENYEAIHCIPISSSTDGNDGNYIQFTEIDATLFAKAKKALLKGVGPLFELCGIPQ